MIAGIYRITNTVNGKVYVGSATNMRNRFACHKCTLSRGKHHSAKLQRAWNKYGEQAFRFEMLLICAQDQLLCYEQLVITAFDAARAGYNVNPVAGNSLGFRHTSATRLKLSKIASQRSAEVKAKIGYARCGKTHSEESRKKMREAARLRPKEVWAAIAKSRVGTKRLPLSDEVKAKLRAAQTGRRHSPETRAKMSAARTGTKRGPVSAATRAKISQAKRGKPGIPRSAETKARIRASMLGKNRRTIVTTTEFS